uniref:Pentatricopeptide repeat-containing protein-mitochondrial domain-containing protein n=1 Tax=Picea sitchensis TaxID=3332 RepID=D5A823_PICSI|nr:unknown [Picea sitchensis]
MAYVRRAGLASVRRTFSTIQLRPRQWSSASPEWPQNLDSTALKTFQNGRSFPRSQQLILTHKFYSTNVALREDKDEEDTLPELSKTDEALEKNKWELVDAAREICQVLEKGDEDMEEALSQLGVHLTPQLVNIVFDKISVPSLALRFFQWAKLQPGFKHATSNYDRLVNILGRSKDFEALQRVLLEISAVCCNYSAKTFSFATAWHDDPDMLNEVMEMLEKLELSLRRDAYEMLISVLCQKNHANAALMVLEKMGSRDCAPRMQSYRPLIQLYSQNNRMDKVQEIFDMLKDCPGDPICYHIVLSALCNKKQFAEAVEFVKRMVNMGWKPDAITYNIMIRAACNLGKIQGALKLFDRSKEEGLTPLYHTYVNILDGLFRIRGFDGAHSFLIQHSGKDRKLDSTNYIHLIKLSSKSGQEQGARNLRKEMKAKGFD